MTNGIFVTENKRLDYQGSAIVNSILTGDIYEKTLPIYKKWPNIHWQKLDLSNALQSNSNPELIFLSRNATPYVGALKEAFPQATVKEYDTWGESL
ncbi:hypothetical protein LCA32G_0378 [Lacticaseibacillus paracasei]|nr:hypothetical protein LCA32G_0378 [Lacticaseibacillus paracasei]